MRPDRWPLVLLPVISNPFRFTPRSPTSAERGPEDTQVEEFTRPRMVNRARAQRWCSWCASRVVTLSGVEAVRVEWSMVVALAPIDLPAAPFCLASDGAHHSRKDEPVKGMHSPPVDIPEEPARIVERGLLDARSDRIRLHFELQPCLAGKLHLGSQPQQVRRLERLHSPEVEWLAEL